MGATIGLIGLIGFIAFIELIGSIGLIGLIGLVGLIGIIGLIKIIGIIGLIEIIGIIGFRVFVFQKCKQFAAHGCQCPADGSASRRFAGLISKRAPGVSPIRQGSVPEL